MLSYREFILSYSVSIPSEMNFFYWFPQNTSIAFVGSFAYFAKIWKFVGMRIYLIDPFFPFFTLTFPISLVPLPLRYPGISKFFSVIQNRPFFNNFSYRTWKTTPKHFRARGLHWRSFCVCWNGCSYSWQSDVSSNYNATTSQVIYKHIQRKDEFSFLVCFSIFICSSIHFSLSFALPGQAHT